MAAVALIGTRARAAGGIFPATKVQNQLRCRVLSCREQTTQVVVWLKLRTFASLWIHPSEAEEHHVSCQAASVYTQSRQQTLVCVCVCVRATSVSVFAALLRRARLEVGVNDGVTVVVLSLLMSALISFLWII